jgi:hypothetical protein
LELQSADKLAVEKVVQMVVQMAVWKVAQWAAQTAVSTDGLMACKMAGEWVVR